MMPLTENTPKPMLEINGQSLLQNKIDLCKAAGLTEININVAYKKNVIIDFRNHHKKILIFSMREMSLLVQHKA